MTISDWVGLGSSRFFSFLRRLGWQCRAHADKACPRARIRRKTEDVAAVHWCKDNKFLKRTALNRYASLAFVFFHGFIGEAWKSRGEIHQHVIHIDIDNLFRHNQWLLHDLQHSQILFPFKLLALHYHQQHWVIGEVYLLPHDNHSHKNLLICMFGTLLDDNRYWQKPTNTLCL